MVVSSPDEDLDDTSMRGPVDLPRAEAAVREFLIGASLIVVLRVRPYGLVPERIPRHSTPEAA